MSITINEALKLESFKDFKIIAGKKGLSNNIKKVGILDHETIDILKESFEEDEFIISTLLIIKDNIKECYGFVEKLIEAKTSGLAIKNIYFNDLPDEVKELANRKSFPIFIFSDVYFEDVITSVTDRIKEKNDVEALTLKIDNILYSDLNNVIIKKIAYEINREFREKNIVVYCKRKNKRKTDGITIILGSDIALSELNKIIPYKDGYLIINTFEDVKVNEIEKIILRRLEVLGINNEKYIIGISSLYETLGELNLSINESMYAFKYSMKYEKQVSFFNKIGTNKVLIPLIDNMWVKKYHDSMILPLIKYDRKNDTELLKTAIKYVGNNGDIKATSKALFQHSNTIRYRIEKIAKILNGNNDNKGFYEEFAIAIRIHNLIN